jgi:hypothetical protein
MTEASQRRTAEKRRKTAAGVRYAYVVLAVMCLVLGAGSYLYTNYRSDHDTKVNNKKICVFIDGIKDPPVAKPADPAHHASEERSYEHYQKLVKLYNDLGC